MRFELTEALVDDILFSMEDQKGEFVLDTVEGVVAGGNGGIEISAEKIEKTGKTAESGETTEENAGRFIPLPEWDSASGFRLMERFAAGFRNPLVREDLSSALGKGKGVFRAFKNVLSCYPEAEKLWFSFKEKEMRREIIIWYNGLREEWGLEKIGVEPEETHDLVLEDFRFRPFREGDAELAAELRLCCLEEYKRALAESGAGSSAAVLLKESRVFGELPPSSPNMAFDAAVAAESSGGEFAGYAAGIVKNQTLHIQNLEVKPEFRGLGVGEALLARLLESLDPNDVYQALLDLPFWAEGFSRVLLRESFKPYAVRYWFDMRNRVD